MRSCASILLLLIALVVVPAAGLAGIAPVPPNTLPPTDPDGDGLYEDLNANGRKDFADVVLYFNQMSWIAANEPVAHFDYNGNGRIDFADVVALFNDLGTGPTPTPSVLISRTVSPSDQDQLVSGGGLNLTIMGGTLDRASLVRVATVPAPPSPPPGTGHLTVYDITVGNQTQFDQPIGIEIPYDPSTIPVGANAAKVIQGVRWDEAARAWHEVPTAVDERRQVVVLAPDHLCVAGFTVELQPSVVDNEIHTGRFVIHFDPSDDAVIADRWKGWGNFTTAQRLAGEVAIDLDTIAYELFVTQYGFRPPVTSRFSDDNRIHVYVGDYYSSEWNPFTKTITVAREPFIPGPGSRERLEAEMRHELFHAVQNAYVWTTWMDSNRWWVEATAEYASTYLYTGIPGTSFPLDAAFFAKPLTTVDKEHEYQSAHFVDQMLDHWPEDFRDLWTASTGSSSAYAGVDAWGRGRSHSLEAVYRDLMVTHLTLTGDPRRSTTRVRPWVLDAAGPVADSNTIQVVAGGSGTGAVTSGFEVSTTEPSVTLIEAWSGGASMLPDGVQVTRFVARPDGTFRYDYSSDGQETHRFGPNGIAARDGDVIFYTVVNGGETNQHTSVQLALTKPDARISPEATTTAAGSSVPFTVSVDYVPFGLEARVLDENGNVLTTGQGSTDGTVILPPFWVAFPHPGTFQRSFSVVGAGVGIKTVTVEVTVV